MRDPTDPNHSATVRDPQDPNHFATSVRSSDRVEPGPLRPRPPEPKPVPDTRAATRAARADRRHLKRAMQRAELVAKYRQQP